LTFYNIGKRPTTIDHRLLRVYYRQSDYLPTVKKLGFELV